MSNSKKLDISHEQAQWLFTEGATLVFLDVPPGTEFGVDYNSWTVGERFKGVKMIPPGLHFIYYSAVGRDRQVAPRTGFVHNFTARELLVKKWDNRTEDIQEGAVTDEEQRRFEENKLDLDRYLGAYPYESYKKWVSLTNHMTRELMFHLQPLSGKISAVTPLQSVGSTTQSRREDAAESLRREAAEMNVASNASVEHTDDRLLPDLRPIPGTEVRFTPIPHRKYPPAASVGDMTRYSMDHSYVLSTLLASDAYAGNPLSLLGEMQFAFVCFLIGQVFEGFEQWKLLVDLLCSCVEAIAECPELYSQFISTLHHHIQEIPEDFFVDIVTRENFLTRSLRKFFENLDAVESTDRDRSAVTALKERGERFRAHLEHRFRWDFGSELDEYAPVVVL